jgi:hypothetical protein
MAPLALLLASACGGITVINRSGERWLEHPPYYAGLGAGPDARIVRYAVTFEHDVTPTLVFDRSSNVGKPAAELVADMNAFLNTWLGAPVLPAANAKGMVGPNVHFGCDPDRSGECIARGDDTALGRRGTTMRLGVEQPSASWIARHAALLDSAGATHALIVTLEGGQYWTQQTGLRGSKSVELGTDYRVGLPWMTSVETPVSVLQVTAALVDRLGKVVRIGAEGLIAQRTPLVASALGAQRLIAGADVGRAGTLRHVDRPGQPLVWQAALCQIVADLARQSCENHAQMGTRQ